MAPLSVLLILPLLVGGVGLVVTYTGQTAMEKSVREMAEDQFRSQAMDAARAVEDVLKQADPVLDNLRAYLGRAGAPIDATALARHLNGVIRLCRAVAYLSWSKDDNGDFMGVHATERGDLVWEQKLDRQADGTVHREVFAIDPQGGMTREIDEPGHRYDPRVTGWYRNPVTAKHRVWTEPYVWFDLGIPGITCAEPVLDATGAVRGVITCDFDLNSLSKLVEQVNAGRETRTFLLTKRQVLLGYPGAHMVRHSDGDGAGENLLLSDIEDPLTRAFAAHMPDLTPGLSTSFAFELTDGVEPVRCMATIDSLELGKSEHGGGVDWFVATTGDVEPLLAGALEHARAALIGSAVAVLVALLISVFFALHLVRARQRVVRAERKAAAAQAEARELGSYRLTAKLGEGGMGQVWIAEHRMLARPVAVKLIKPEYLIGSRERSAVIERFNREAQTMARLRSRHTIEIYDFGVGDDGTLFYVMELLHGLDLHDLVSRYGAQPVGRVLSILRQAASSLAEAHAAGLVHRDIKPANIYLCVEPGEYDVVKVLDFGMVRATSAEDSKLTLQGSLHGTPAFMSPEQVSDPDNVDGRGDLYALVCVGYWLLGGREVFQRDSVLAMVEAHVSDPPPPLDEVAKVRVPAALAELFARCLAKDRDDRPTDMAAFLAELDAIARAGEVERFDQETAAAFWANIDLTHHAEPAAQTTPTVLAGSLAVTRTMIVHAGPRGVAS